MIMTLSLFSDVCKHQKIVPNFPFFRMRATDRIVSLQTLQRLTRKGKILGLGRLHTVKHILTFSIEFHKNFY